MLNIFELQKYIPAKIKYFLKPYYRVLFPNKLHIVFFPTFRCNYKCSYCYVHTKFDYSKFFPKEVEKTASEWLAIFEKLPSAVIYIAGGEPFLYSGLIEVVNNMPPKHQVAGIVTNLSVNTETYRHITIHKLHLNVSLHREYTSQEHFVEKIKELKDQFDIHVNIVAVPANIQILDEIKRFLSKRRIPLHVDPYVQIDGGAYADYDTSKYLKKDRPIDKLDHDDYGEKACSAGRNYLVIVPNGDAFTCAGGMNYLFPLRNHLVKGKPINQFRMGNVFDRDFQINPNNIRCSLPCLDACDYDRCIIKKV